MPCSRASRAAAAALTPVSRTSAASSAAQIAVEIAAGKRRILGEGRREPQRDDLGRALDRLARQRPVARELASGHA